MRVATALLCCAVSLTGFRPAVCLQAPGVRPGVRIRFDAPHLGGRMTGTLVAWESDTLVVSLEGDAPGLGLIVPADSVTRLDLRRERRMTLEGAGVGVLAGVLLALVASPDWVDENGDCTTPECLAYGVSPHLDTRLAVLGVGGALLGAIAGAGTTTDAWVRVPLKALNLGATQDGGLALGVKIFF